MVAQRGHQHHPVGVISNTPRYSASPAPALRTIINGLSALFDLSGTTALVTGGNGGIGYGMASGLASAGANVVIVGTNAAKNAGARDQLDALGAGEVLSIEADVSSADAVAAMFDQTIARFGHIDACFANAGIAAPPTPFVDQTVEQWRAVMAVNLEGTFLTIRTAARHMIASGRGGSLVTVSSLGEMQGMPTNQPYAASKAGVTAMTLGVAVELARHKIRANVVQPGFTRTEMTPHLDSEPFERHVLRRVPLRRWGEPTDFAGIAVYLVAPASSYQTGQTFLVDGGYLRY